MRENTDQNNSKYGQFSRSVHVVIIYDYLDVLHAAVTHFNFILVECLIKGADFWEMGIY